MAASSCSSGITPARAGKTQPSPPGTPRSRDHPRSRGENVDTLLPGHRAPGITPARAGKTRQPTGRRGCPGDHPRSRGENEAACAGTDPETGSPPLARGKLPPGTAPVPCHGITPARAGKTHRSTRRADARTDHPRSRGENPSGDSQSCLQGGSPPLARGKRRPKVVSPRGRRITPARAGKTRRFMPSSSAATDHPRSRGENQALG